MKKVDQIDLKNKQNQNKAAPLERYNVIIKGNFFNKSIIKFPILTDKLVPTWDALNDFIDNAYNEEEPARPFPPNTFQYDIDFVDMPDWVIPMLKIKAQFHTDEKYAEDMYAEGSGWRYSTEIQWRYVWEKIANKNYRLHIFLFGIFDRRTYPSYSKTEELPFYINLHAWFVNKNYYSTIQHNQSKY